MKKFDNNSPKIIAQSFLQTTLEVLIFQVVVDVVARLLLGDEWHYMTIRMMKIIIPMMLVSFGYWFVSYRRNKYMIDKGVLYIEDYSFIRPKKFSLIIRDLTSIEPYEFRKFVAGVVLRMGDEKFHLAICRNPDEFISELRHEQELASAPDTSVSFYKESSK